MPLGYTDPTGLDVGNAGYDGYEYDEEKKEYEPTETNSDDNTNQSNDAISDGAGGNPPTSYDGPLFGPAQRLFEGARALVYQLLTGKSCNYDSFGNWISPRDRLDNNLSILGAASGTLAGYSAANGPKVNPFPGWDASSPPSGYQWKGSQGAKPGSSGGNYYNPDRMTTLRPDLNHSPPIEPHWDYRDPSKTWYRIFPNGRMEPK